MSKHAEELEPKIRRLHDGAAQMAGTDFAGIMLPIVHRPGFTTVHEARLVHAMLDTLNHHMDGLRAGAAALVAAAEKIGAER